ncbi:nicotinamide riboside transporter PnuC [Dawidia soli]|uniref:Nicotinamide riboside transporter PnuC n=1 Tax=Dawidia soli TaxID=2782352 RepID=A0AAP2D9D3_9BACT|nr:nicotinamide riboside transporter PnuC [Dawidia soli]MBT1686740.1 nicotinamide riboside transporter PnuC [Dawidia soli]
MSLFSIDNVFFEFLGYKMSYLEFFGAVFGAVAVWLSARADVLSWPIGIVNVVLSFFLYYQIQLYPDMFLQVFFFVTNVIGWWQWTHPKPGEEDQKQELKVSYMGWKKFVLVCLATLAGTAALGAMAARLHEWFPFVFALPSAFPYADSFILVMSIITTFFMIRKKIECWVIWIIVDVVATYLYYIKGVMLYSVLYFAFTIIAAFGLWHWIQEYRGYSRTAA